MRAGSCDGHGHGRGKGGGCRLSGGWVRGLLQPRLILLLLERPAHGYELMERLADQAEMPGADPGLLYRTLRQLEADGMLSSTWDTEGQGPARRLYQVTPEGVEFLHAWALRVGQIRQRLKEFLNQYEAYFQDQGQK